MAMFATLPAAARGEGWEPAAATLLPVTLSDIYEGTLNRTPRVRVATPPQTRRKPRVNVPLTILVMTFGP